MSFELAVNDFKRSSADLFLLAAKSICLPSVRLALLFPEEQPEPELEDKPPDSTLAAREPLPSGVPRPAGGTLVLLVSNGFARLLVCSDNCRRSSASLAALSSPSGRSTLIVFISAHLSRDTLHSRRPGLARTEPEQRVPRVRVSRSTDVREQAGNTDVT